MQYYLGENKKLWAALDAHEARRAAQIMTDYVANVQRGVAGPLEKLTEIASIPGQRRTKGCRRGDGGDPSLALVCPGGGRPGLDPACRAALPLRLPPHCPPHLGGGAAPRCRGGGSARRARRDPPPRRRVPAHRGGHQRDGGGLREADPGDGRLCRPDLEGRHPAQDHRRVPGRVQRHQGEPEPLHRRLVRAHRRDEPDERRARQRGHRRLGGRAEVRGGVPHHGPGRERHGGRPHQCEEEGHGRLRRVREGQLRRHPGAAAREEAVHQRHHRPGAEEPEGPHRRAEPDVQRARPGRHRRHHRRRSASRAPTAPWPRA